MKEKNGFGGKLEAFFEGKGFYIVLFLCAAVIGVSAWTLVQGTSVENRIDDIGSAGVMVTPPTVSTTTPPTKAPSTKAPTATTAPEPEPVVIPNNEPATQVWNEQSTLFVRPVNGETITPYAVESLIYDKTMSDWRAHSGIDIAATLGDHVLAVSAGEVTAVEDSVLYGTTVTISHANGVESVYANLAGQPTVLAGDRVSAGDIIGAVGNTAICESGIETHLHFAMRDNGASADPERFLP